MGLIRSLLRRKRAVPKIVDTTLGAPPGTSTSGAKRPRTRQKPVVLKYENSATSRAGFRDPEYDLSEIYQAGDTEGFLRISFDKHEELILKSRWSVVGQNSRTRAHVLKRLTEIAWNQNEPIERVVERGIEQIVEVSNVFYVLARREVGKKYKSRFNRHSYPISGIFSPNPASMRPFIKEDKRGNKYIDKWKQIHGGVAFKTYDPTRVIHMPFRQKQGNVFGTPYSIPALDDILALRRIEELANVVIHKNAFPFFHYRVGTEKHPAREYDDGYSEVEDVRAQVASMPFEGGLVTPYRHEIVVLGTKNKAMDITPYIKHYEARVLSELNLSGIDVGRGETANRSTAQTMSRGLSDRCTRIMEFFAAQFTFYILDELVMELGIDPTPENRVYLVFPTIDTEERRARENHALAMFQGQLYSETEARVELGRDPFEDEQRKETFFELYEKPLTIMKAVDEPYTKEAKGSMASKRATANREQPENRSKRLTSKPRVSANDAMILWDEHKTSMLNALTCAAGMHHIANGLADRSESWLSAGAQRYALESGKDLYIGANIRRAFIEDILNPRMLDLARTVDKALITCNSKEDRLATLDALAPIVEGTLQDLAFTAENYGYARIAQVDGHKYVSWELEEDACEECKESAGEKIRIHRFKEYLPGCHTICGRALKVSDKQANEDFS